MAKSLHTFDRQATFETDAANKNTSLTLPVIDQNNETYTVRKNRNGNPRNEDPVIDPNETYTLRKNRNSNNRNEVNNKNKAPPNVTGDRKTSLTNGADKSDVTVNSKPDSDNSKPVGKASVRPGTTVIKGANNKGETDKDPKPTGKVNGRIGRPGTTTIEKPTQINKPHITSANVTKSTSLNKAIESKTAKKDEQTKSTSLSKAIESKTAAKKDEQTANSAAQKPKDSKNINQKQDPDEQIDARSKVTEHGRSRSPEKKSQVTKASVLNNINRHRSKSPDKRSSSPQKGHPSGTDSDVHTEKLKENIKPVNGRKPYEIGNARSKPSLINQTTTHVSQEENTSNPNSKKRDASPNKVTVNNRVDDVTNKPKPGLGSQPQQRRDISPSKGSVNDQNDRTNNRAKPGVVNQTQQRRDISPSKGATNNQVDETQSKSKSSFVARDISPAKGTSNEQKEQINNRTKVAVVYKPHQKRDASPNKETANEPRDTGNRTNPASVNPNARRRDSSPNKGTTNDQGDDVNNRTKPALANQTQQKRDISPNKGTVNGHREPPNNRTKPALFNQTLQRPSNADTNNFRGARRNETLSKPRNKNQDNISESKSSVSESVDSSSAGDKSKSDPVNQRSKQVAHSEAASIYSPRPRNKKFESNVQTKATKDDTKVNHTDKTSKDKPEQNTTKRVPEFKAPDKVKTTRAKENINGNGQTEVSEQDGNLLTIKVHDRQSNSPSPKPVHAQKLGRLSPTNDSVEQIKLEPRPVSEKMEGRETYSQVFAERNTLLKAEYAYKMRIKQLEDEANSFLKAIEDLTNENRSLQGRLDDIEGEVYIKGGNSHREKIAELESENAKLVETVSQYANQANREDETRDLKEEVVQLQSENQKTNSENKKLRTENDAQARRIKTLERPPEKTPLIQDTNDQLQDQLTDYKLSNKGLENKVYNLEYENKTLSDSLAQKTAQVNELLLSMKDGKKFENEMKELKDVVSKLTKEKRELELSKKQTTKSISEKLEATKASLIKLSSEYDELKIKHDQAERENKKMKPELAPLKKQCAELKSETERLQSEANALKEDLQTANDKYNKVCDDNENANSELEKAHDELERFNKELQGTVSEKESQISKLIHQLDSLRQDRETERKSNKKKHDTISSELKKLEKSQAANKCLEADLKHCIEKLDESKLSEKQLALRLEDKEFQVSNLEQQVFEMNMKLDNNSKRMHDLDRGKRDIEKEKREWDFKKDKFDDIEASNKRLLEENKRLRNQLELVSYTSNEDASRLREEKGIVEAWVHEKSPGQTAEKRVNAVQPNIQKKRQPFTKSTPAKPKKVNKIKKEESPSKSLEDLTKVIRSTRTPDTEYSLPELHKDARMTVAYGNMVGYADIHKTRMKTHKRVY